MQRVQLCDALEEEIASGVLAPGDRLDESVLAARFGVSRTPVREALTQLAAIGLLTSSPRRGKVVVALDSIEIVERFQVMAELEAMAGRLAARRWRDEDRERLSRAHDACRKAVETGDADTYYYENERFHDAIYTASRNTFLHDLCSSLHRRLKPYRRLQLRVSGRIDRSFEEHAEVIDAILARDEVAAKRHLRDHVAVQGDRFVDLMASMPRHGLGRDARQNTA